MPPIRTRPWPGPNASYASANASTPRSTNATPKPTAPTPPSTHRSTPSPDRPDRNPTPQRPKPLSRIYDITHSREYWKPEPAAKLGPTLTETGADHHRAPRRRPPRRPRLQNPRPHQNRAKLHPRSQPQPRPGGHRRRRQSRHARPRTSPARSSKRTSASRPKAHYRTGRHAAGRADRRHTTTPAAPTWTNSGALGDALTGIVWRDDARLAEIEAVRCTELPACTWWCTRKTERDDVEIRHTLGLLRPIILDLRRRGYDASAWVEARGDHYTVEIRVRGASARPAERRHDPPPIPTISENSDDRTRARRSAAAHAKTIVPWADFLARVRENRYTPAQPPKRRMEQSRQRPRGDQTPPATPPSTSPNLASSATWSSSPPSPTTESNRLPTRPQWKFLFTSDPSTDSPTSNSPPHAPPATNASPGPGRESTTADDRLREPPGSRRLVWRR